MPLEANGEKPFSYNFPDSGVKQFVGREGELNYLHQQLEQNRQVAITAISGMGGIGKTELALQYASFHYQEDNYPGGVCWLRMREQKNLASQLLATFKEMEWRLPEELELEQQARWCWRNWKPQEGKVLVILDDVSDFGEIAPYLPSRIKSRFRVLMTTRLQRLGATVQKIQLDLLSPEAALNLLQSLIGEKRIQAERVVAAELCEWLGYLPLGLELAGYSLQEEECPLEELLTELKERKHKILHHAALTEPVPTMTAKYGVAAAFELSWERLDIDARFLGAYLSLFAATPIRWELVVKPGEVSNETYEALKTSRRKLIRFSLLKKVGQFFQFHPLIQQFFAEKRESDEFIIPPSHQITGATTQILRLLGIPE